MKAVNPALTHAQAAQILRDTADAGSRCSEGCGTGLVNPTAAVNAAAQLGGDTSGQVRVFNTGGQTLTWQASVSGSLASHVSVAGGASGSLAPGDGETLTVSVSRGGLSEGNHQATLNLSSNGGAGTVAVIFRVGAAPRADVGELVVGTFNVDSSGEIVIGGAAVTTAAQAYGYQFPSEVGEWYVLALSNGDDLGPGDVWGMYPTLDNPNAIQVTRGGTVGGLDFALVPYTDLDDLGEPPCTPLRRCWEACESEACMDACPATSACETCWDGAVLACAQQNGCDDTACVCTLCEPAIDSCFGPHACWIEGDDDCPGAICFWFDDTVSACLATCTAPGTCPRPQDGCVDIDEPHGVCLPD